MKVWPWSNAEAIVCSQNPELALMAETLPAGLPEEIVSQYMASADLHIWGAVLFAVIGFSLVTGIEVVGKMMKKD